ncbi:acetyl-CoA carboxylase / biotin carboxylase 1 [Nematocida sp. LUAm3]|nr:acetyl-CoA carboxylase / biotin carboxylase 1 [Nematocida sp. LUAm3]KAI5174574.1 acetyl-CoA carboxylase / biotin carboxylase 1 [Nematocida sp. LUAm2]KAI5178020.1 acetyl-CoA carboxylase / biotin carboxylase 1 [Nematocida sp. LUAm1]
MPEFRKLKQFIEQNNGTIKSNRIFVANNSLAAVKYIISMNDFSFRHFGEKVFQFYGMSRPSDIQSESKYLELLTDYAEFPEENTSFSFRNPKIICQTAENFNCSYLWPGWGHSSEDPELPSECAKRNIIFLGPSQKSMQKVGGKISANLLAESCGVKSIPWMEITELQDAINFCHQIKFPIMVKSQDGGGGKGIRKIEKPEELIPAIEIVKKETNSEKAFVAKYLEDIKHIEVQIVSDRAYDALPLSTRDCTIQRRNQKLIEEGPSLLPNELIEEIKEVSKRLMRAAEYQGLCTIEFVYDRADQQIYFLEANPRLQVEHTVTELLGGVNLCVVQWMVGCGVILKDLVASELLGDFQGNRHVVAARVIAENPANGFTPSCGSLFVSAQFPVGCVGYFGVDRGEITQYNDSQFGHVFGIGKTREEAIDSLKMILSSIKIIGEVKTLNGFLFDLISTDIFRKDEHNTQYAEEFRKKWIIKKSMDRFYILCFSAIYAHVKKVNEVSFEVHGVRVCGEVEKIHFEKEKTIYCIIINGGVSVFEIMSISSTKYIVRTNGNEIKTVYFMEGALSYEIIDCGVSWEFFTESEGKEIRSSLSGRVLRYVKEGSIEKNEEYIEVESMKNIIRLKAPRKGSIVRKVEVGDAIQVGQALAEYLEIEEKEKSVKYQEKIEYINTKEEFTANILEGYKVHHSLLSYEVPMLLYVAEEYLLRGKKNELANEYLITALKKAKEKEIERAVQERIISYLSPIRHIISRYPGKSALAQIEALYGIEKEFVSQKEKKVLEEMEALPKEEMKSFFKKNCHLFSSSFLLSFLFVSEVKKEALLLWIKKTFNKEAEIEENSAIFSFGQMKYLLCTELPKEETDSFIFLVEKEKATDITLFPYLHGVTQILITETLSAHYQTYYKGKLFPAYAGIDPIIAERFSMAICQEAKLEGILWERKLFFYSAEEQASVFVILTSAEIMNAEEILPKLFKEIEVAYTVKGNNLPLSISILIADPVSLPKPQLIEHMQKSVSKKLEKIKNIFITEITIKGTIEPSSNEEKELLQSNAYTITSPGLTEKGFYLQISLEKSFKECKFFIEYQQIFHLVEETEISAKKDSKRKEEFLQRRRKAFSLNTIYLYDFIYLLEILFQEKNNGFFLEEILAPTPCAMKAWKAVIDQNILFVLVGNDITENNGAFSVDEDIFFANCGNFCLSKNVPFIYVSSNSGAKIEVFEPLKPVMLYDEETDTMYLTEEQYNTFKEKDLIEVQESEKNNEKIFTITSIIGNYGMGVENLSYSAEIANTMARMNKTIPTITYATGRAVGIGAYLARLSGRVIQKSDSPIILTGFQALNKLLNQSLYANNLQIGGPEILSKNGTVHRIVQTDEQGAQEIIHWLSYILPASPKPHPIRTLPLPVPPSHPNQNPQKNLPNMEIEPISNNPCENYTPEEIITHITDKNSFIEYLSEWAPNVQIGRAKINGLPCGVIFPRSQSVSQSIPSSPPKTILWTQNVLLPESSKKIAQSITEFSLENLNILILVNWRGFTAGHTDMLEGSLEHGADIVNSMASCKTKIFTYLPPNSELRGGSWVVFDKKIAKNIHFSAHPTASGGVIHPNGLAAIKFKEDQVKDLLKRSNIKTSENLISKAAKTFCSLHDLSQRMLKMKVIDKILPVSSLKQEILNYFQNPHS